MVARKHVVKIGRLIRKASRVRGGAGSALPGLVVEKLDPHFAAEILGELPHGVVVITGTNGKTTTTKMVAEMLAANGLKVFTNKTGSNFTRGVIAGIISEIQDDGILDADIAILELDEAYATRFVQLLKPRYCLLLNVMRDQLDRFGEIDHTAKLLEKVAKSTTHGVVLNRDDPLIRQLSTSVRKNASVRFFGLSNELKVLFPSDSELYGKNSAKEKPPTLRSSDVLVEKISNERVTFAYGTKSLPPIQLKISGIYNIQNAAAAFCLARMILGEQTTDKKLLAAIQSIRPAFGRGEAIEVNSCPLEIILVKNPSGFRLALESYAKRPARTMIAINDNYADGRDMSWLWDVDFSPLGHVEIISGIRAYDMALRLQYDDVEVGKCEPSLEKALEILLREPDEPRRIFCTYTAMMKLRALLAKQFDLEGIDA